MIKNQEKIKKSPVFSLIILILIYSGLLNNFFHANFFPLNKINSAYKSLALASSLSLDQEEQSLLFNLNNWRQQNGLASLSLSPTLEVAAKNHSQDMAGSNYFSHTSLDGRTAGDRVAQAGYTFTTWTGENLAWGFSSGSGVFDGWKNSSGHNANMLSNNYKVVGIGRAYDSDGGYGWIWTADFGGYDDSNSNSPPSIPSPTPIPETNLPTPNPVPITPSPTPTPQATPTLIPIPKQENPLIFNSEFQQIKKSGGELKFFGNDVEIKIPPGAFNENEILIIVNKLKEDGQNIPNSYIPITNTYEILARTMEGNEVKKFELPIEITLKFKITLNEKSKLKASYYDKGAWKEIADTEIKNDKAQFKIDHLTVFGIFYEKDVPNSNSSSPIKKFWLGFSILGATCLIVIPIYLVNKRKARE